MSSLKKLKSQVKLTLLRGKCPQLVDFPVPRVHQFPKLSIDPLHQKIAKICDYVALSKMLSFAVKICFMYVGLIQMRSMGN